MKGTFDPGEKLYCQKCCFDALQTGDIIIFFRKSIHIVHRIIKIANGHITTQGDNNLLPDPWDITPEEKIFQVTHHEPGSGIRLPVRSGEDGMKQFRSNQLKLRLRIFSTPLRKLLMPLMFWRRYPDTCTAYGTQSVFTHNGMPVAVRKEGITRYSSLKMRILFRLPEENGEQK